MSNVGLALGIFIGNFFGGTIIFGWHPITGFIMGLLAASLTFCISSLLNAPQRRSTK